MMQKVQVETVVNTDISKWAPEVLTFLKGMRFGTQEMSQLLVNSSGKDWNGLLNVACEWIKQNENVWRSWVPLQSSCLPGQGMFATTTQSFVHTRGNTTTCQTCSPGRYSSLIRDDTGDTAECRFCQPGFSQSSHAAVSCTLCSPGSFSERSGSPCVRNARKGSIKIKKQALLVAPELNHGRVAVVAGGRKSELVAQISITTSGTFVLVGVHSCPYSGRCGPYETTRTLGASQRSHCECQSGSWWQEDAGFTGCRPCSRGMYPQLK